MVIRDLIEEGDPANDQRLFRRSLAQFGTGIAIITTSVDGQHAGVTVNSVASVSLSPPLILWSISRQSRSFALFAHASNFSVNILAKDQIEVSRIFSSASEDKFEEVPTFAGVQGVPLITGAIGHLECVRAAQYDGGDHVILVGRVVGVRRYDGAPLLFVQGRYSVPADHPDLEIELAPPADVEPSRQIDLIPLIFEAHHLLSAKFDAHRAAEGLSASVARVVAVLHDHPGISLDVLARRTYLGTRDIEDALQELIEKKYVTGDRERGFFLTAAGTARRQAILKRWLDFQRSELRNISDSELGRASSVLSRLMANAVQEKEPPVKEISAG